MHRSLRNTAAALGLLATAATAAAPALAQAPPPGLNSPPPPGYAPYNVPPPQGYAPGDARYDSSAQARTEDERYAYQAEQWAAANCQAQRANNTATGAVIGGILGALVGSGLSSRRDSGAGIVTGGALGAIAGGAIGSAQTSPNCPPGYVLRRGAAPFYGGVVYGAPPSWDPWVWYGGHWIYRPYPYHRYWYRTHPPHHR